MNQLAAKVLSNEKVMPGLERESGRSVVDTHLMCLEAPEIASEARPGQFVMVRCGENILPRPISLHGVKDDAVMLLYDVWEEGKGTRWLAERRSGEEVIVLGALGNGFLFLPLARNLLLVAGGIGIAPIWFLAERALATGRNVRILAGASTSCLLSPPNIIPVDAEYVCATEDGTAGESGLVTDLLGRYTAWADQVFACGPLPMYRTMAANLKKSGLERKPVQVSLEMRMACGLGVCYGCTVNTKQGLKQVCKDGPVFDLGDIVWDGLAKI